MLSHSQSGRLFTKSQLPVQIVKVDYPRRESAKIVEAYYKTPSTTDYNGLYREKIC
ncbi:MAG: Holliday junction resolvase RecU [Coprobacillus cateniformis]